MTSMDESLWKDIKEECDSPIVLESLNQIIMSGITDPLTLNVFPTFSFFSEILMIASTKGTHKYYRQISVLIFLIHQQLFADQSKKNIRDMIEEMNNLLTPSSIVDTINSLSTVPNESLLNALSPFFISGIMSPSTFTPMSDQSTANSLLSTLIPRLNTHSLSSSFTILSFLHLVNEKTPIVNHLSQNTTLLEILFNFACDLISGTSFDGFICEMLAYSLSLLYSAFVSKSPRPSLFFSPLSLIGLSQLLSTLLAKFNPFHNPSLIEHIPLTRRTHPYLPVIFVPSLSPSPLSQNSFALSALLSVLSIVEEMAIAGSVESGMRNANTHRRVFDSVNLPTLLASCWTDPLKTALSQLISTDESTASTLSLGSPMFILLRLITCALVCLWQSTQITDTFQKVIVEMIIASFGEGSGGLQPPGADEEKVLRTKRASSMVLILAKNRVNDQMFGANSSILIPRLLSGLAFPNPLVLSNLLTSFILLSLSSPTIIAALLQHNLFAALTRIPQFRSAGLIFSAQKQLPTIKVGADTTPAQPSDNVDSEIRSREWAEQNTPLLEQVLFLVTLLVPSQRAVSDLISSNFLQILLLASYSTSSRALELLLEVMEGISGGTVKDVTIAVEAGLIQSCMRIVEQLGLSAIEAEDGMEVELTLEKLEEENEQLGRVYSILHSVAIAGCEEEDVEEEDGEMKESDKDTKSSDQAKSEKEEAEPLPSLLRLHQNIFLPFFTSPSPKSTGTDSSATPITWLAEETQKWLRRNEEMKRVRRLNKKAQKERREASDPPPIGALPGTNPTPIQPLSSRPGKGDAPQAEIFDERPAATLSLLFAGRSLPPQFSFSILTTLINSSVTGDDVGVRNASQGLYVVSKMDENIDKLIDLELKRVLLFLLTGVDNYEAVIFALGILLTLTQKETKNTQELVKDELFKEKMGILTVMPENEIVKQLAGRVQMVLESIRS
ncbi:hypothetical protein BLNAU_7010 [Blattamonas nauphoetae]|uniref:RNA polymerase II assembly factor Rtp1 C-terminal domain-containing protein n=1 Tax=Blattamonas nauphoetae TaxID=2049346 RepID=A0ABQ9Y2W7_9EUKA|nr:hypothetical protein BLNAU_7010 [Blattamonas nauphoetae]